MELGVADETALGEAVWTELCGGTTVTNVVDEGLDETGTDAEVSWGRDEEGAELLLRVVLTDDDVLGAMVEEPEPEPEPEPDVPNGVPPGRAK